MRGSQYFEFEAFAAIVEHGSFRRAADMLSLTPSALSQLIRQLEARLDTRLLNRSTRSLSTTESGARFYSRIRPALTEVADAVDELKCLRRVPTGTLRIHASRLSSRTVLEPLLGSFLEAYPGVILDISVDDARVSIVEKGFDLGIQLAGELDNDYVAIPFGGGLRYLAVASPTYLTRHGAPVTPSDLKKHRCIGWRPHGDGNPAKWEFVRDGRSVSLVLTGPLIVSERNLAAAAAVQGVGVAFLAEPLVRPYLQDRRLVGLLEEWSPTHSGFQIYYHKQHQLPPTVRAFLTFVDSVKSRT
jgi:DNA-binding transcriptional LysR family regulator